MIKRLLAVIAIISFGMFLIAPTSIDLGHMEDRTITLASASCDDFPHGRHVWITGEDTNNTVEICDPISGQVTLDHPLKLIVHPGFQIHDNVIDPSAVIYVSVPDVKFTHNTINWNGGK